MKLSAWTHPKTGQTRIYLNDGYFRSAKVWIEKRDLDQFGSDFDIMVRGDYVGGDKGNLQNTAEQMINDLAGRRVELFEDVLALVH